MNLFSATGTKVLVLDTAKVLAITDNKCTVKSLTNGEEYFKCSVGAVLDTTESHLSMYPKVGSVVTIGIFSEENTAVLLAVSDAEKVVYKQESTELEIDKDGFKINRDGKNLKTVLNEYQDQFGKLCDEVSKIVVSIGVTPNVGAITAIKNKIVNTNKNDLNTILK